MNKEANIITLAVKKLGDAIKTPVESVDRGGRWAIRVTLDTDRVELDAYGVDRLDKATLAELVSAHGDDRNGVLVVDRVTEEQGARLREASINYVDAGGNAFLRKDGVLLFVDRQREKRREDVVSGRAFQPAGLKVLFTLLVDPGRADESYRDIAERVGVSTGAVTYAMDDLERLGYVIKVGKRRAMRRRLKNVDALAKHWAERYGEVLRPKLSKGRFRLLETQGAVSRNRLELDPAQSCWGGEVAADAYTQYLRPEVMTIYTEASTAAIAKAQRMVPDPDGDIEVLEKFWRGDVESVGGIPAAPEILAYADLLASNVTRNLEAAQRLFDRWSLATTDRV